jgi:hypothetical protein
MIQQYLQLPAAGTNDPAVFAYLTEKAAHASVILNFLCFTRYGRMPSYACRIKTLLLYFANETNSKN